MLMLRCSNAIIIQVTIRRPLILIIITHSNMQNHLDHLSHSPCASCPTTYLPLKAHRHHNRNHNRK